MLEVLIISVLVKSKNPDCTIKFLVKIKIQLTQYMFCILAIHKGTFEQKENKPNMTFLFTPHHNAYKYVSRHSILQ